ncbi:phosphatidylethanolamine/phosphatidyl-N-methylethanolamine N-methyltransferase [uncultured bacterium]|nr:phosphatidylethanolamine/phosphatidyl-N-methylethanolamine N-methyltransferase [uncultured bacterium]
MHSKKFLFLERWIKNPLKIGAIMPASSYLVDRIVHEVINRYSNHIIIEAGAGTGSISKKLINSPISIDENTHIFETDPVFFRFLKSNFKQANIWNDCISNWAIYCGNAKSIIVVSSLPLKSLPHSVRRLVYLNYKLILGLHKNNHVLQYSYGNSPPTLDKEFMNLIYWKKICVVFRNIPPATLWELKSKD